MVGSTFTYLLGSEAATLMFNSKNEDLNAEDVYSRLTTPVFGKGVAYDVPNPVSPQPQLVLGGTCLLCMNSSCDSDHLHLADLSGAKEDAENRPEHRPL